MALNDYEGPFGRGFSGDDYDVVLLAVPDSQISAAASVITPGRLVGHCSGATTLDALAPHEAFSVHPLMTVPLTGAVFSGAGAAVAGTSARSLALARELAVQLGMSWFEIDDANRAAYHAAACIASNFFVTLEDAAETLLASAGGQRSMLVPLIRAALDNWAAQGSAALTGPIARGDHETVARQRAAIAERTPSFLPTFDALREQTEALARRSSARLDAPTPTLGVH
jgi:predicted short-subunit dehydrogenase-like oxidoreductase (DUF2520 family)